MMAPEVIGPLPLTGNRRVDSGPGSRLLAGTSWELLDILAPGLSPAQFPLEPLEVGSWLGLGLGHQYFLEVAQVILIHSQACEEGI